MRRLSVAAHRLAGAAGAGMIVAASLFPIYMMAVESLKTAHEDVVGNPFIVTHPTLRWYLGLFAPVLWLRGEAFAREIPFVVWFGNTAMVMGASLALTLAVSVPAAYALGRLRPPGWRLWRRILFGSYLIPQTLAFLPMYQLIVRLGLDDNLLALLLVYPGLAIPFCVWLLSAYFQRLAPDVEDAALVEGASRTAALLRVVLPMSWPVVAAAGIFALGVITGDAIFAAIFLPNQFHQTLSAGLGTLGASMADLSLVAGVNLAAFSVVPVVAAFAAAYVRGLSAAMVEGG
jgi:multiple sugar transport system permease protein